MKRGERIKPIAAIAISMLLFVVMAGIAEAFYERVQAERAIALLSEVQVGKTTEIDAREIMKPFSFRRQIIGWLQKTDDSSDQFQFWNSPLPLLHLAPQTDVWVTLDYEKGVVSEKSVLYIEAPRCGGSITESALSTASDQATQDSTSNDRHIYIGGTTPSPTFIMKVKDNTRVPFARRSLDWQIDLSCMTKIGGCRDPRKVLRGALLEPTER